MMDALERAAMLMTLLKRIIQIKKNLRAQITSLQLDDIQDLLEELAALTDGKDHELEKMRRNPNHFAGLDPKVTKQVEVTLQKNQDASAQADVVLLFARDALANILQLIDTHIEQAFPNRTSCPKGNGKVVTVNFKSARSS